MYLSVNQICHCCHETLQKVRCTTLCTLVIFPARLHEDKALKSTKDVELNRSDKTVHMTWV
jgi:hypothetical protein